MKELHLKILGNKYNLTVEIIFDQPHRYTAQRLNHTLNCNRLRIRPILLRKISDLYKNLIYIYALVGMMHHGTKFLSHTN